MGDPIQKILLLTTLELRNEFMYVLVTLMVRGGTMCLHFSQIAINPLKKGSGGLKFLDSSFLIINFQKIKKILFFHSVLGYLEAAGILCPPALKLHSKALHY